MGMTVDSTGSKRAVTIIGAGLVGSLLATLLAQRGFDVEVFERRPDPRLQGFVGGRSINLALAERGLAALAQAGVADAVLAQSVMMRGRMIHALDGALELQRYGLDDSEVIRSVSRGRLNVLLIDAAERVGVHFHFDEPLVEVDFANDTLSLGDHVGGVVPHRFEGLLLGCDGAGSTLRAAMSRMTDLGERTEPLGHGYKELEIPSPLSHSPVNSGGGVSFALEPNALHIWPRGHFMCIALPNTEGNFTVTLFLPNAGPPPCFDALPEAASARQLFAQQFPDALALMPTFDHDWDAHPVGQLATLYLDRWHLNERVLLLGDAAHAVVPFHGQGMNAGFEDAAELARLLEPGKPHTGVATEFQRRRKPNADAIAAMSLANYIEMRDGVADAYYLLKRGLAAELTRRAPDHFMSRYRMVSFTTLPYAFCSERDAAQTRLLQALLAGHTELASVDLDAAEARVRAELPRLPNIPPV